MMTKDEVRMLKVTALAMALVAATGLRAAGQDGSYGEAEYIVSCAVCHGRTGEGDGPLAEELRTAPPNLTLLSQSNGGEFPYWKVFALIDGRLVVPGHGTRDMPVWGREFLAGDEATYGPRGGEAATQERIHALAEYLASLQR